MLILNQGMPQSMTTLDKTIVHQLKATPLGDGQTLFTKICEPFIQQTKSQIQTIEKSLPSEDFESIFQAAHSLKSASATIGALSLSSICLNMEQLCREAPHKIEEVEHSYIQLKQAFTEVEDALQFELHKK